MVNERFCQVDGEHFSTVERRANLGGFNDTLVYASHGVGAVRSEYRRVCIAGVFKRGLVCMSHPNLDVERSRIALVCVVTLYCNRIDFASRSQAIELSRSIDVLALAFLVVEANRAVEN